MLQQPMDDWCAHLLDSSTAWLSDVVLTSSSTSCDEDLLVKHLHTVGDAAQRSPKNVPKRLLLATQALLTNPGSGDDASMTCFRRRTSSAVMSLKRFTLAGVSR